jgi:hypothetical protein
MNLLPVKYAIVKKIGLYLILLLLLITSGYGLLLFAPGGTLSKEEIAGEFATPTPAVRLSEKALFDAINDQRKAYGFFLLKHEESTCAIAKARVSEVYEQGVAIFNNSASFQRTIDKVIREDDSIDLNTLPDSYREYITYAASVEDAMQEWITGDQSLFLNAEYKYGCVAEKDGYAVIMVGYDEYRHEQDEPDTETETDAIDTNGRIKTIL